MQSLDRMQMLDWSDFDQAGARAAHLLEELASDQDALRNLVDRVLCTPSLLAQCERHTPYDKIVLYDGMNRGFRVRLHIWNVAEFERAHQHRFPLAIRILRGSYKHIVYSAPAESHPVGPKQELKKHMDADHEFNISGLSFADIRPCMTATLGVGQGYVLHQDAIHATLPIAGCVSLCLRGPTTKDYSIVIDRDRKKIYWRFGREDETAERIARLQMRRADLDAGVEQLSKWDLI